MRSGKADTMTRVLIVDDSPMVRNALRAVFATDPDIEVVGAAGDPFEAVELMNSRKPQVLTLDIEMPRMDGLTFLERIMAQHPIPVIVCSTLVERGAKATLRALELGAVDIITKPKLHSQKFFEEARVRICDAVKAAALVRPRSRRPTPQGGVLRPQRAPNPSGIILIGASTGGTEALRVLLSSFPADGPPVAIVQHMPENFTRPFAARLNELVAPRVSEAVAGEALDRGRVVIAPGDRHLLVRRGEGLSRVQLRNGPLVSRHRPSVDVLFRSAAQPPCRGIAAAILTGMGEDGSRGMAELSRAGARTMAQDKSSSVVHSMPSAAMAAGGVQEVLPLEKMAARLLEWAW